MEARRSNLMSTLYAAERGKYRNATVVDDPEGGKWNKVIDNEFTSKE